jgi:hypothetical protein
MTFWPDPIAYEQFKKQQAAAFKRIARATRGAQEAGDIESEAWFMAQRIGEKRGSPLI